MYCQDNDIVLSYNGHTVAIAYIRRKKITAMRNHAALQPTFPEQDAYVPRSITRRAIHTASSRTSLRRIDLGYAVRQLRPRACPEFNTRCTGDSIGHIPSNKPILTRLRRLNNLFLGFRVHRRHIRRRRTTALEARTPNIRHNRFPSRPQTR